MAPRSFTRNPEKVEDAVKEALEKLRSQYGDEFKASVNTILENVDKRRVVPSRPSVYKCITKLVTEGWVTVSQNGARGTFMYKFPEPEVLGAKRRGRPRKVESNGSVPEPSFAPTAISLDGYLEAIQTNKTLRQVIAEKVEAIVKENETLANIAAELAAIG